MDDLLRNAFTNEGLRRMTRKAGVSSTREKDLIVNDELRVVAFHHVSRQLHSRQTTFNDQNEAVLTLLMSIDGDLATPQQHG